MSTRCVVRIKAKGQDFDIYHHCDGYPFGVGQDLLDLIESSSDNRGFYAEDFINLLIKNPKDDGYEFTTCPHGDLEYIYEIDFGNDDRYRTKKDLKVRFCEFGFPCLDDDSKYRIEKWIDLKEFLAKEKNQ